MPRTFTQIDIEALESNLSQVPAPKSRVMAMVKADAYGHGAVKIAQALRDMGVQHFGVATLAEALELRQVGMGENIYLTCGFAWFECAEAILENDFISFASSFSELNALDKAGKKLGRKARVHVKLDTGMRRMGFLESTEILVKKLEAYLNIEFEGICSHLASNDSEHGVENQQQNKNFNNALSEMLKSRLPIQYAHIANSSAIVEKIRRPVSSNIKWLVRPGLMLYGYHPLKSPGLKPVLSWFASIILRKTLEAQECVGYGFTYRCDSKKEIAILGVGYADGLNRLLSNQGYVLIEGIRAPIIGQISMDSCAIDVTAVCMAKGVRACSVGQRAVIIGRSEREGLDAWDLARICQTIPYEVLTAIGKRVTRL